MGVTINVENIKELRIWEYLENSSMGYSLEDVAQQDVTLVGMNQTNWALEGGKRTQRDYLNEEDEVVVRFVVEYAEDSNGQVVSVDNKIQFMDILGDVGLEKEILKELSDTKIVSLNIEIRTNQINNLRGRGNSLRVIAESLPEPAKTQYNTVADNVDFLWTHYEAQINNYEKTGSTVFKGAVEGETDTTVNTILDIVANADGVTTVRDTILTEIN